MRTTLNDFFLSLVKILSYAVARRACRNNYFIGNIQKNYHKKRMEKVKTSYLRLSSYINSLCSFRPRYRLPKCCSTFFKFFVHFLLRSCILIRKIDVLFYYYRDCAIDSFGINNRVWDLFYCYRGRSSICNDYHNLKKGRKIN
jgi:hypothetical protein